MAIYLAVHSLHGVPSLLPTNGSSSVSFSDLFSGCLHSVGGPYGPVFSLRLSTRPQAVQPSYTLYRRQFCLYPRPSSDLQTHDSSSENHQTHRSRPRRGEGGSSMWVPVPPHSSFLWLQPRLMESHLLLVPLPFPTSPVPVLLAPS